MTAALARLCLRPAFLFFAVIELGVGSSALRLFSDPDVFGRTVQDPGVLPLLIWPLLTGILLGQAVQELQHTTFAWPLPALRRRLAVAFAVCGVVLALFVYVVSSPASGTLPPALLGLACAAFCFGGIVPDPVSGRLSVLFISLALALPFFATELGWLARTRPTFVWLAAAAITGLALHRLFAASTFRRKPSVPTLAGLSSFWPQQTERYEREKMLLRPVSSTRSLPALGGHAGRWVAAAVFESWGRLEPARALRLPLRVLTPLFAIVALGAWIDRGDAGFLHELAQQLSFVLLQPPGMAPPGRPPTVLVPFLAAGVGVTLALQRPIALLRGRLYPISRATQGRVAWLGLAGTYAVFLLAVGGGGTLLGWLAGALGGQAVTFGYLPNVLRSALVTAILLPLASQATLNSKLQPDDGSQKMHILYATLFGAMILVPSLAHASRTLLPSPLHEVLLLGGLLTLSLLWILAAVRGHYRCEDLA